MQNLSLLLHLPGECLLDPFQSLLGPPQNQPGGTSCFLGQIGQSYMVFQVSTDNLRFLLNGPAFFLPFSGRGGFSMDTSFLVRVIA